MNNNKWYDCFLEALYEKYPQKPQLTEALMDLLSIEREAVYRRLRNDVIFPANEIIKIASSWNISIDEILGVHSPQTQLFKLKLLQYTNPSIQEMDSIQEILNFLDTFREAPNAEFMEVSNTLPRSLMIGFQHLARYILFKWKYQYDNEETVLPYSQVLYLEKVRQMGLAFHKKIQMMPKVNYIWDYGIFERLVNDIKYFSSIYLITEDEKQLIKNDILALLDYMSDASSKNCFPETGNTVNLYISQIGINTNYNYFYSDTIKLCCIRAFVKYEICSTNEDMVTNFHKWMSLKKRSSVNISGVDERSRIAFFMKQRELVETL